MMRAAFRPAEFEAGFEHVRQAMLQGLQELPPGLHAGSWTIGAYCALVRLVWEQREPSADRLKVGAVLGAVLSDVLREADPDATDDQGEGILDVIKVAIAYSSPRDEQGAPMIDGDAVRRALAAYAYQLAADGQHWTARGRA